MDIYEFVMDRHVRQTNVCIAANMGPIARASLGPTEIAHVSCEIGEARMI